MLITGFRRPVLTKAHTRLILPVAALALLALLGGAAASLVTGSLCTLTNVSTLAFLGAASLVLWRTYRR